MIDLDFQEWLDDIINKIEAAPLALITKFGLWLTPAVPAFFVQRAMVQRLDTPQGWAWVAALALEIVGVSAANSLLRAYQWERERRKSDPAAPIKWNAAATSVYYVTAFLLVLFIEIWPDVVKLAPAAFVILSGTSALVLALVNDQRRREKEVRDAKKRSATKRKGSASERPKGANLGQNAPPVRVPKAKWRDEAARILREDPDISGADLGREIGASVRTGQLIKRELGRNGHEE